MTGEDMGRHSLGLRYPILQNDISGLSDIKSRKNLAINLK